MSTRKSAQSQAPRAARRTAPAKGRRAPEPSDAITRLGDALHAASLRGDMAELLARADLRALLSPRTKADARTVGQLATALADAVRALDDDHARLALLLEYLQTNAGQRAAARAVPLAPWDAPRVRATQHRVNPGDISGTYSVWLDATLADLAEHFAAGVGHGGGRPGAANLALARMLRAAVLSSRRGDLEELEAMAEPARLYLQRSTSPQGDVVIPVPESPAVRSTSTSHRLFGDPPGSVVMVPCGDIVAQNRQHPAVLLRDALASVLSSDTSPPRTDVQIVMAVWSYLVTPLFQPIVRDLPPLPLEPSDDLSTRLVEAVHRARLAARGSNDDAEDTAERVLRALLRALGYPLKKTRSLLDPLRKRPAES